MISASSLDRVLACPASEALEHGPSADSKYSSEGTEAHRRLAEMVTAGTLPEALAPFGQGRAEVAYAYDLTTRRARELKTMHARDYSQATPTEIAGTVDVAAPYYAGDWKTGWHRAPSPSENAQMLFAGLALSLVHGTDTVRAPLIYVRAKDLGLRFADDEILDWLDFEAFAKRLEALPARVEEQRARLVDGHELTLNPKERNCRYCPAVTCPNNGNKESKAAWRQKGKAA